MAAEVDGERSGGRAGRRILGDPDGGAEHPELPLRALAGEAVDADALVAGERGEVGAEGCDRGLVRKPDEDVARAVLVHLDREERLLDAERGEQFVGAVVELRRLRGLRHPPEHDLAAGALEPEWHDRVHRFELHLVQAQSGADDERAAKEGMSGEGQLGARREDPDANVAAALGRQDEDRLRDVQLSRDRLHLLRRERSAVREHAELVPFEGRVGEDVEDVVGVALARQIDVEGECERAHVISLPSLASMEWNIANSL